MRGLSALARQPAVGFHGGMTTSSNPGSGIDILDESECWNLLTTTSVGRLAVSIAEQPDIFPINYLVDDGSIVFRSGPGTKLAAAALLHHVAFEIDGYEPAQRTAWSVVVKGWASQIEKMQEVYAADDLPLFPWVAFPKPDFVRITPREITGRRFHVLDDVTPDQSLGWDPVSASPTAAAPAPGVEYHPGAPRLRPD